MSRWLPAVVLVFVPAVAGWSQEDVGAKLDTCVSYYEFGEYMRAADSLKALLPLITDRQQEARAYKYLGFSYAMLEMVDKSKAFFRVALEKFPDMVVDTLEVPPNILVVYKQVRLEKKVEKSEAEVERSPKRVGGTACLVSGIASTAMCAYFLYNSQREYDAYLAVDEPNQSVIDQHYDSHRRSLIAGVSFGAGAFMLLPAAIVLYVRAHLPDEGSGTPQVGLIAGPGRAGLGVTFEL